MVHMSLTRALALAGCLLLAACHVEDHTPAGSRRDEAQIREVLIEFYRGLAALDWAHVRHFFTADGRVSYLALTPGDSVPETRTLTADSAVLHWARLAGPPAGRQGEARIIRADLRQADGVAAVWVTVRLSLPFSRREDDAPGGESAEHLVLHRTGDGWRIALLSLPWAPR
jgi:hypothetical protein